MKRTQAHFDYTIEQDVVCIVDLKTGMSVTNDAENVILTLLDAGVNLRRYPVIYRDTQDVWDELVCDEDGFLRYRSLGQTDKQDAIDKVKNQHVTEIQKMLRQINAEAERVLKGKNNDL